MGRRKAYWLPILAVLLIAPLMLGCVGREDIASILEQADTLAKDDPKKAIALVTSYNYNNNNDMRAHAYYTHALSQQRYNNLPMAALMLNGAAKALESYHNPSLEGSVYSTLGDIYFKNILYSNSYDYYSHAAECFSKAGLENEQYLALRNKGWSAFKLHRYDEAKYYLNLVYEYSTQQCDRELSVDILQKLCDIYLYTKDIAKLNSSVELLDGYIDSIDNLLSYYCLKSIVCSLNNDIDNAIHYIECAKSHGEQHSPYIKRAEHYIYRCTGEDAKSIESLELIIKELEKIILNTQAQPILNDQIELLKQHIDNITYVSQMEERREIAHTIILVMIILLMIYCGVSYRRKTQHNIQQYMDTINELQLTGLKKDNRLEPLVSAIDHLYNDRLSDVNQLCEIYYEHSDTPRQSTKVFEQVRHIIETLKSDDVRLRELEELVDRCRNGLMSKLREGCDKLNDREIKVALYSYAGFSSRAICIFIDSNPVALSKMKYRIKAKIKESECEDAELLISALN